MLFPMPNEQDVLVAMLIFLRVSALMILIPVLGHKLVPQPVKTGLILLVTFLLYPVVSVHVQPIPAEPVSFVLLAVQEMLFAGVLALLANLIFATVQFAGQVMSIQMGMSIANVFDPATSAQGAIVAQFSSVFAMLLWLSSGAHHMFILALVHSFTVLPIGQPWSFQGWDLLNDAAANMFALALRLMAPVLLLLFFINVSLGLVSRAVPQIQVFFVSFPITLGMGILALSLAFPAVISLTNDAFVSLGQSLPSMMRALAGG